MKSRRTASSAGVPKVLSERFRRSTSPVAPGSASSGSGRFRKVETSTSFPVEEDVGEPEAAADDAAVAEEPADVLRAGVGPDVEVLRGPSRQEIAYGAADEVRLEPGPVQAVENLQGVGVDCSRAEMGSGAEMIRGSVIPAGGSSEASSHSSAPGAADPTGLPNARPAVAGSPSNVASREVRSLPAQACRTTAPLVALVLGAIVATRFLAIAVSPGEIDETVFAGAVARLDMSQLSPGAGVSRLDPDRPGASPVRSVALLRAHRGRDAALEPRAAGPLPLGPAARRRLGGAGGNGVRRISSGGLGERREGVHRLPSTALFLVSLAALGAAAERVENGRLSWPFGLVAGLSAAAGAGVRPHLVLAFGPLLLVEALRLSRDRGEGVPPPRSSVRGSRERSSGASGSSARPGAFPGSSRPWARGRSSGPTPSRRGRSARSSTRSS